MVGGHRLEPTILERAHSGVELPRDESSKIHAVEYRALEPGTPDHGAELGREERRRSDRPGADAKSCEGGERLSSADQRRGGRGHQDRAPINPARDQNRYPRRQERNRDKEHERCEPQECEAEGGIRERREHVRQCGPRPRDYQEGTGRQIQEERAVGGQIGAAKLGDVQEPGNSPVLREVLFESPPVGVCERRADAAAGDRQHAQGLPSRKRGGSGPFRRSEERDEHDTQHAFDVQIAPEGYERDGPHKPSRKVLAARPLDEQHAHGDPGEGDKVRSWDCPGLDDEETEHHYGEDGGHGSTLAARQERENERQCEQSALGHLDSGAATGLPGEEGTEVEEPGCVGLRVRGVQKVEDVGVHQAACRRFTPLREVPPEIGFVDGPKTEDRGGGYREQEQECCPLRGAGWRSRHGVLSQRVPRANQVLGMEASTLPTNRIRSAVSRYAYVVHPGCVLPEIKRETCAARPAW